MNAFYQEVKTKYAQRRAEIKQLFADGVKAYDIARKYGISRARVYAILKSDKVKNGQAAKHEG